MSCFILPDTAEMYIAHVVSLQLVSHEQLLLS
jgi:hypothetical protein